MSLTKHYIRRTMNIEVCMYFSAGLFILLALSLPSAASAATMPLRHSPECVLKAVLAKKKLPYRPDVGFPPVRLESKTSLREFQDAVEPQWGMRPDVFTNVYVVRLNEIFLMDDLAYYERTSRFVDDSLAHELTHYVQSKYLGWELDGADDSIEMDAIEVQTWFRDEFMKAGKSPCGA